MLTITPCLAPRRSPNSGPGFMQAPAAGMVIADLVTLGAPAPDVLQLTPGRFLRGAAIREPAVI